MEVDGFWRLYDRPEDRFSVGIFSLLAYLTECIIKVISAYGWAP